jgi:tape measure domain-containing protein
MATTVAELTARLDADTSRFDRGLRGSESRLARFGGATGRIFGSFARTAIRSTVAVGAAFAGMVIYKGAQRAIAIDDANRKLEGLGYTAQEVAKITDDALKSVLGTPYSLAEALNVASTAMAAGVDPGRELSRYLGIVADTASIAGTSMQEMGSLLNKATANVRVHTDVLNSLADRGLPIFTWLQEEYGVTGDKLREMVERGEVDSKTLMRVIEENIGGAAQKAGEGIRGSFSNLVTAIARLGDAFLGPVFGSVPKFFMSLRDHIDDLTKKVKPLGEAFGRMFERFSEAEGLQDKLQVVLDAVDWAGIGTRVGDAISDAITVGSEWVGRAMGAASDWIGTHQSELADLGARMILMVLSKLLDPGFWLRNWQLILGIAVAIFPATRFLSLGVRVAAFFLRPIARLLPAGLRNIGSRAVDAILGVLGSLPGRVQSIILRVIDVFARIVSWIRGQLRAAIAAVPGWVRAAFRISALLAFIGAIKAVIGWIQNAIDAVQRLIDKINSIPSPMGGGTREAPGAGGGGERFQHGGIVPGPLGAARWVLAHGGETILPTHKRGLGGTTIVLNANVVGGREAVISWLTEGLRQHEKRNGRW